MKLWRRKGFINANQKEGSASFWKKQTCYQFEYLCSARVLAQSWKHIRIQFLTHEHRQHEIIRTRGRWSKTRDRLWEVGTCGGCNPLKCQMNLIKCHMNQPFASESLAWCRIILILAFSFFMSSTQEAIHLTPARHHMLNIIVRSLAQTQKNSGCVLSRHLLLCLCIDMILVSRVIPRTVLGRIFVAAPWAMYTSRRQWARRDPWWMYIVEWCYCRLSIPWSLLSIGWSFLETVLLLPTLICHVWHDWFVWEKFIMSHVWHICEIGANVLWIEM